jgi:hypothetical protein
VWFRRQRRLHRSGRRTVGSSSKRDTIVVGNIVHNNNQSDTPAIGNAILVMGNGIIAPGGIGNVISKNLVFDHDKTGISLIPFPGDGANDDLPTEDEWTVTCDEQREQPPADEIPDSLIWEAYDNNVVSGSGQGDLAVPPPTSWSTDAITVPAAPEG